MDKINCPICDMQQKQKPKKTWAYGKMIEARTSDGTEWGASVRCSYFECKCGKLFRYYLTEKGKSWTIPKRKSSNIDQ